jgi:hypothetical protein
MELDRGIRLTSSDQRRTCTVVVVDLHRINPCPNTGLDLCQDTISEAIITSEILGGVATIVSKVRVLKICSCFAPDNIKLFHLELRVNCIDGARVI